MIITFGSVNYDFIFRLENVPQAGQTLLADSLTGQAGGKGANQAVAAARDGAKTIMVGAVGQDGLAEPVLANLVADGVDVTRIAHLPNVTTGCASITINAQGQNTIIVAAGANMLAKAAQIDDDLLAQADIVLIQMETSPSEITNLIRRAHELGKMIILNLAPAIYLAPEILALCSLIIVNEDEAEALGHWLDCAATAQAIATKLKIGIMRTLGSQGSEAFISGEIIRVEACSVKTVDTTAAGDCFIGVLAASLERGIDMRQAMQRASKAAALACSREGSQASIPYAKETDQFLAHFEVK